MKLRSHSAVINKIGVVFIMEWYKLFEESKQPTFEDINNFIRNDLWQTLNAYLQDTFKVGPKLTYSKCSMQKGWNTKYQKGGKSLCTLYPMEGYFIALIVVGKKELEEVEMMMPLCCEYLQDLYASVDIFNDSKWLMINVTKQEVLEDVKKLIHIRVNNGINKSKVHI